MRFIALGQSYINQFTTVKKYRDAGRFSDDEWNFQLIGTAHVMNTPGGKWLRKRVAVAPNVEKEFLDAEGNDSADGFWAANQEPHKLAPNK